MKHSTARLIGEFSAALHIGPGPHPDGTPQSVHGGGTNLPPKPPRREWLRVKFYWPTYDPTAAFSPVNPDPLHIEGKSLDGGRIWTPLKGRGDIEAVRDWMMLNGLSVTSYEQIGQKRIAGRWHGLYAVVIGERAAKAAAIAAARLAAEFTKAMCMLDFQRRNA